MKFYRVDESATDIQGQIVLDDTHYIEQKIDTKGRIYYLMVEDYTNYDGEKHSHRIRNNFALNQIKGKKYSQ